MKKTLYKKILKTLLKVIIGIFVCIALVGGGVYGYVRYQIYSHEQFWKELAQKPAPPNAIVYVALGDSLTQGIGSPDPMQSYVGQFATKVSQSSNRPVHIVNISESGGIAEDVIKEQLPQLKNYKPDIVTIAIGSNDVLADTQKDKLFGELEQIAGQLPEGAFMADLPTFERGLQRDTGVASREFVKKLAEKNKLHYVPLNQATEPKFWDIDQYGIDLLHPSVKQYTIWADTFWKVYSN